uniref:YvrJ family protein n=1 Tax=viral metagenome TaxID=1070528 RepID=A0A6H1ZW90_9ZZZZ
MDLSAAIQTYLVIHGVSTVGAVIVFLIRNEHRITKLETSLNNLKESHDALTDHGTIRHDFGENKL